MCSNILPALSTLHGDREISISSVSLQDTQNFAFNCPSKAVRFSIVYFKSRGSVLSELV